MGVESLLQQGLAFYARRDYAAALARFDEVLAMQPRHLHALNGRGGALLQLGRAGEAAACFEQVLAIEPRHVMALNNRGSVLAQLGRHAEALACFERAAVLEPGRPETRCNRALMLDRLGRHEEALRGFDAALALDPRSLPALRWKARTLQRLGRHAQVLECGGRALQLAPADLELLNLHGLSLSALERYDDALDCFDRALRQAPDHAGSLVNRGSALFHRNRADEALRCFERALAAAPELVEAKIGYGMALLKCHRDAEALDWYNQVLSEHPDHTALLNNRGAALLRLNRLDEALGCFEQVLAIEPEHADAQYSRSFVLLARGELAEGFRGQEKRWRAHTGFRLKNVHSAAPLWLGETPLQGRSILLYHEQGLGDTLQFMRYAPRAAARGARVILGVPPELLRLARSLPGVAEVVDREPLPPHDLQCPMMSLPLAFGTTLQTIPAEVPYLHAEPLLAAAWRERLEAAPHLPCRPRIGLVWAGRQEPPLNQPRDMPLDSLLPLLDAAAGLGLNLVSLQKDIPHPDRALLEALPRLARHGETLADFADTAALLVNLDLLVTVDTSVAHLAGALGRPVWLMNRYASCWRWFQDRTDSPWYPPVRIFRQPAYGDWDSVVAQVAAALAQRFGSGPESAATGAPLTHEEGLA